MMFRASPRLRGRKLAAALLLGGGGSAALLLLKNHQITMQPRSPELLQSEAEGDSYRRCSASERNNKCKVEHNHHGREKRRLLSARILISMLPTLLRLTGSRMVAILCLAIARSLLSIRMMQLKGGLVEAVARQRSMLLFGVLLKATALYAASVNIDSMIDRIVRHVTQQWTERLPQPYTSRSPESRISLSGRSTSNIKPPASGPEKGYLDITDQLFPDLGRLGRKWLEATVDTSLFFWQLRSIAAGHNRCTGPLLAYTGALGFLDAGIRWAAPSLLQRCTAPWDRPVGEGGQTSGYAWLWQPPFHQHDLVDQKWRCRGFWDTVKNHVASSVVTTILAGPFVTMQMAHCCNKERHVAMLQDVPYHVSIAMALVASARELGSCVGRLAELQDQVDLMAYLKRPGRHFEVSDAHIDTSVQNPPEMDLACKGSSRECLSPAFQSESGSGFEATSSGSLEVSSCSPVLHKERVGCGEHVHGRHTGSPFTSKRCRITQKSANADQSTNRKAEAAPSQNGNANTAEPVALNSSEEYIVFHDTCQDDDCSSLLDPATKLAGLDTGLPDQTSKRVRSPKLPAPSTDKDHIGGGSPRVPKFQSISCPVSSWMAIGSAKMEPLSLERSFPAPRISGSLNSDTPVAHNDGLYSSPMVRRKFQGTPAVFVVTPGLDEKHFCEQEWTAQADNAFSQESLAHSSWEEHETAIYNEMMVVFAHCAHHKGAGLVSPTVTFGRGLRVASGSPVPAPICRRPLPAPQRTMSSRKQGTKGIRLPRLESPL